MTFTEAGSNYRRARSLSRRCATCANFQDGGAYFRRCLAHPYGASPASGCSRNHVCDKFAPNRKETTK